MARVGVKRTRGARSSHLLGGDFLAEQLLDRDGFVNSQHGQEPPTRLRFGDSDSARPVAQALQMRQSGRVSDDADRTTSGLTGTRYSSPMRRGRCCTTACFTQWLGPAPCSDAVAIAIGYSSAGDLHLDIKRLLTAMSDAEAFAAADWRRLLISAEIIFGSDVRGAASNGKS